jgi:hypothetical protein
LEAGFFWFWPRVERPYAVSSVARNETLQGVRELF